MVEFIIELININDGRLTKVIDLLEKKKITRQDTYLNLIRFGFIGMANELKIGRFRNLPIDK